MRRTALLVSTALLTGLLPLAVARAADDPAPVPVDRFEGEVPFASPPAEGIFTWGSDADDPPTMELQPPRRRPRGREGAHGTYDISGYGGFSHDFAFDRPAHDWSAHKGIRFWWYGQNTAPLPPVGQADHLRDQGRRRQRRGLRALDDLFTDDWQGWHLVEIPFTDFVYRTDYQPVGGIDHVLDLTQMWGYALTLPVGVNGSVRHRRRRVVRQGRPRCGRPSPPTPPSTRSRRAAPPQVEVTVATTGCTPLDDAGDRRLRDRRPAPPARHRLHARSPARSPSRPAPPPAPSQTVHGHHPQGQRRPRPPRRSRSSSPSPAPRPRPRPRRSCINAHGLPYLDRKLPVKQRVADLLVPDDPGREGRPDDPGRARRRRGTAADIADVRARLAALRRRLGADAEHAGRPGRT